MKNLIKRNRIILAIISVLVIAIIAVVAFSQVSGAQLFGTDVVGAPKISPSSATIIIGQSAQFTLNPAANCTWGVGSPTIATIMGSNNGSTVTVVGLTPGTTYVGTTSNCAAGKVRANVTVPDPWASAEALDPPTMTSHLGDELYFSVSGMDCAWSSSNTAVLSLHDHSHDQWNNSLAIFRAVGTGSAQARAGCISYISGNGHQYVSTITVIP